MYKSRIDIELNALCDATSKDPTRFHLTGIYFDHEAKAAAATDGHRLAKSSLVYSHWKYEALKFGKDHIFDPKYLSSKKDKRLVSLGSVKFPNWKSFIPDEKQAIYKAKINFPEWLSLLQGKDNKIKSHHIGIYPSSQSITIGSKPRNEEKDVGFFFNAAYLASLSNFENLKFSANFETSPGLFISEDFTLVVMPIRPGSELLISEPQYLPKDQKKKLKAVK